MFLLFHSITVFLCVIFFSTSFKRIVINRRIYSVTNLSAKPSHKVTLKHLGVDTVLTIPEDVSILSAALDAGIELPYDCKLGVCLTCPSRIVSGKVDQSEGTLEDSVKDQGYALTCISYPRSDVVITSIDEDELVSAQFSRDS